MIELRPHSRQEERRIAWYEGRYDPWSDTVMAVVVWKRHEKLKNEDRYVVSK